MAIYKLERRGDGTTAVSRHITRDGERTTVLLARTNERKVIEEAVTKEAELLHSLRPRQLRLKTA